MARALITGGAGFFGTVLKHHLLDEGWECHSVDLCRDDTDREGFKATVGDIAEGAVIQDILARGEYDVIFHCAALLAHEVKDKRTLWRSNVEGTRMVAEAARDFRVPKVVFISSNCLWGDNFRRPVTEEDEPRPVEVYGRSKWEGEKILLGFRDYFDAVILRSPTIISPGRLGLLTILFDFIRENRKVWVVGDGSNVYQFVYAPDLAKACRVAFESDCSGIYNVGSDDVKPLADVYMYVIDKAHSRSRIAFLPKGPTLLGMWLASALGVSPLGPYQRRMIAEDFVFDTSKIKRELGWKPTMTNEEMLHLAYGYYHAHFDEISRRTDVSAHSRPAKLGVLRLIKWLS